MNRRRKLIIAIGASALSVPFPSFAQQPGKVWRIGMLETRSMALNAADLDGLLKGMQELGYAERRNFVLDYRSADGRAERFPDLAAELIRGQVDLIVTRGTPATLACKKATTTIPVVTASLGNPLLVVNSLARPGGNITGLTSISSELQGKRVQLLKEIVPGLARLAHLQNMGNPSGAASWKEVDRAARSLGLQPQLLDVRKPEDFAPAFDRAVKQQAIALLVEQDGLMQAHEKLIVALAAKHRLPAIYQSREYVDGGGLISYGVSYADLYRRAAAYVDKILKGAKPGDLPMEQPTKFDLVINLKVAKALGITVPQSVLVRTDQVIG